MPPLKTIGETCYLVLRDALAIVEHYCSLASSTRVTQAHFTRVMHVHATLPVSCTVTSYLVVVDAWK